MDFWKPPHGYVYWVSLGKWLVHCTRLLGTHFVIRYTVVDVEQCRVGQ